MGGIVDDPLRLFYLFFKIAFYSIWLHLQQAKWLDLPGALIQSALVLVSAVRIIWRPIFDELQP